ESPSVTSPQGRAVGSKKDSPIALRGGMVTSGDAAYGSEKPHALGHRGTSVTRAKAVAGSRSRSTRRRGRTHVSSYTRGRAAAHARRGRHHVPGRPQDRHPVGQGRQVDVDPHPRRSPALPGDRGPGSAGGDSAAALGVGAGSSPTSGGVSAVGQVGLARSTSVTIPTS